MNLSIENLKITKDNLEQTNNQLNAKIEENKNLIECYEDIKNKLSDHQTKLNELNENNIKLDKANLELKTELEEKIKYYTENISTLENRLKEEQN